MSLFFGLGITVTDGSLFISQNCLAVFIISEPSGALMKNDDLFVMKNDKEEIVATISIDHDDAVEALTCWRSDLVPSGELSRLCVRKDMQGQGIAKIMMNYACDVLKSRGMKGVHILVREGHVVALSTYAKIGFETVGECDLFDKHFICMEREF